MAVYTQPDRPRGRGRKLRHSEVKQAALELGLSVRQPEKFAGEDELQRISDDQVDILVVVAYGQILPIGVLQQPRFGAVNVHASLLPRWRGAAPIQRALLSGDDETGITLMQMEAGLDTGPMLLQRSCVIEPDDSTGTLQRRLARLGADCLIEGLSLMAKGPFNAVTQSESGVTYAHKISKSEANIDWDAPSAVIDRQIRAFNPIPGAFSHLSGERIKILACELTNVVSPDQPGILVEVGPSRLGISTADTDVRVTEIQPAGGKPMAVKDFLNARELVVGAQLSQNPGS